MASDQLGETAFRVEREFAPSETHSGSRNAILPGQRCRKRSGKGKFLGYHHPRAARLNDRHAYQPQLRSLYEQQVLAGGEFSRLSNSDGWRPAWSSTQKKSSERPPLTPRCGRRL